MDPNTDNRSNIEKIIEEVNKDLLGGHVDSQLMKSLGNLLGHPIEELDLDGLDRIEFAQFETDYFDR